MKQLLLPFVLMIVIASCKNNNSNTKTADEATTAVTEKASEMDEASGHTATFKAGDAVFTGKVSTQFFGDKEKDQFSVLCQQDEPFTLLQATFANKAAANGSLKPADGFYSIGNGEAFIALSGANLGDKEFVTSDKTTGSISVEGNQLLLKDLKLFNKDRQEKTVNAAIEF
ncbi:MAG: hypothetical protein ACK5NK_12320 [Niabella sp.]